VRNLPSSATKDDVQQLVAAFGTVQRCDLGWSPIVASFSGHWICFCQILIADMLPI